MDKEQLEQLIYQAFEEGFYAGFMFEGERELDALAELKLAQELGW
jgi:hypothetical protein